MSNESMIRVFLPQFSYLSFPPPPPVPLPPPPPPPVMFNRFSSESKISQSVLLIIIILAVIFFISGILHLLVRCFLRPRIRDPDESDNVTVLQGQLQQLFNLHDAGVDQSFIDTLPVFLYKTLMGAKNPFDCAVCLCEFQQEDKLRLLPKCSHAFHMECIDIWLLSHSTCPLCRSSLLLDFSPNICCSPIVFVLESNDEDSREISPSISVSRRSHHLVTVAEDEFLSSRSEIPQNPGGVLKDEQVSTDRMEKTLQVKLGKFRNVDCRIDSVNIEASSSRNVDDRRCFSMGSFEYVLDESSVLKVAVKTPATKERNQRIPGYRSAMSECDFHSRREGFKEFEFERITEIQEDGSNFSTSKDTAGSSKTDSFSISKIWLRHKRETSVCDFSRRASFRLPISRVSAEESRTKDNNSNQGSDGSIDEEIGSVNSLDSTINSTPSFARKTLLWLMGRQNKMVHSSSANPV